MRTNVSERCSPEKRVYYGVDKNIAVRMGLKAIALRNDNPAENKGLPALEEV
jgi:hypothetical protein